MSRSVNPPNERFRPCFSGFLERKRSAFERRNLASQCLALAAREIPGLWMSKFHYRPLLAETFCDIEHSAGTCYKAAGWTPLGLTKGLSMLKAR